MKNYIWIGLAALVVYFLVKRGNGGQVAAPGPNRTTSSATPPFWEGWDLNNDRALRNTTVAVNQEQNNVAQTVFSGINSVVGLWSSISGLWSTRSQGPATNPATTGSGVGPPSTGVLAPAQDSYGDSYDLESSWDPYGQEYNPAIYG